MRSIGVITAARSDYGIYLPILRKIQEDPALHLHLLVTGMHLSPEFGLTVELVEADGFEVAERIDTNALAEGWDRIRDAAVASVPKT